MPSLQDILEQEVSDLKKMCSSEARAVAELIEDVLASAEYDRTEDSALKEWVIGSLEVLSECALETIRSIRSKSK